jgi:hypothetical protein
MVACGVKDFGLKVGRIAALNRPSTGGPRACSVTCDAEHAGCNGGWQQSMSTPTAAAHPQRALCCIHHDTPALSVAHTSQVGLAHTASTPSSTDQGSCWRGRRDCRTSTSQSHRGCGATCLLSSTLPSSGKRSWWHTREAGLVGGREGGKEGKRERGASITSPSSSNSVDWRAHITGGGAWQEAA